MEELTNLVDTRCCLVRSVAIVSVSENETLGLGTFCVVRTDSKKAWLLVQCPQGLNPYIFEQMFSC